MNLQEAYKILEVNKGANAETIKKSFRRLAAKYHPDVNKAPDAEAKFKEINEAHELLTKPKAANQQSSGPRPNVRVVKTHQFDTLKIPITIFFEEAVLGFKKTLQCQRYEPCQTCQGGGTRMTNNQCKVCDGRGKKVNKVMNFTFVSDCNVCFGQGSNWEDCADCQSEGTTLKDRQVTIECPGGLALGQVITVPEGGHYIETMWGVGFDEAQVIINYEPNPNMKIEGSDVVSTVSISLLEALQGLSTEVDTIKGKVKLKIPAKIRNKDKLRMSGYGCRTPHEQGHHMFIIDVAYPEDKLTTLIDVLKD